MSARKSISSDPATLTDLLDSLKADQEESVSWSFESEKLFRDLLLDIHLELDSDFRYLLILGDGTEGDFLPKYCKTNDPYLQFCSDRPSETPETDTGSLMETSLHFLKRKEDRIQKKLQNSLQTGNPD